MNWRECLDQAEFIAVGIGKEWELKRNPGESDMAYGYRCRHVRDDRYDFLENYLKNRDYFIVSTNTDTLLTKSFLKRDRMVFPCGSYQEFQCPNGCGNKIQLAAPWLDQYGKKEDVSSLPLCPVCGSPLVFHVRKPGITYVEEGYLPQWNQYLTWLSKTLGHATCFLELGENLEQPSVFRFPWERLTEASNKATLIRVHKTLGQLPKGLGERGISIQEDSMEFSKKLC